MTKALDHYRPYFDELLEKQKRKILHVDMDAFYASVEILDQPDLADKAVIVGGAPDSRAVVAAANYKAREFGIHSAMACSEAKRLCPDAVFVKPRFQRYRQISNHIHFIFRQYSNLIEPISLDEAWLDVTKNFKHKKNASSLAKILKQQVLNETGLVCSVGVSFNKFLAKVASDEDKPDGLFVIHPQRAFDFLMSMELKKIPGVGKVTHKRLQKMGLMYGSDLIHLSKEELISNFGKFGNRLFYFVRGYDDRPVSSERERKSISVEDTFSEDLPFGKELEDKLESVSSELSARMKKKDLKGRTLTLKLKFFDFKQITRTISINRLIDDASDIFTEAQKILYKLSQENCGKKPVRLIGVGISNFVLEEKIAKKSGFSYQLFDKPDD